MLDATTARRWVDLTESALRDARGGIDALNVFPVPDGDTGTNLHLTVQQARDGVRALTQDAPLGEVCAVLARSALLGARGNSGIITSQLLRGWADQLAGCETAGSGDVAAALVRADDEAWSAVESPVEGTMLSVTRAAALAAASRERADDSSVEAVLSAAAAAARSALEATTDQLPALRAAGVVDAGGAGIVLVLEALLSAVTGNPVAGLSLPDPVGEVADHASCAASSVGADASVGTASYTGPQYEVMYVLRASKNDVARLRGHLSAMGESLVVVGDDDTWHVHVHVDDPGGAIEAAVNVGTPSAIRVTHLVAGRQPAIPEVLTPREQGGVGVVAWAAGPGIARLFTECGVVALTPPSGRRASTGEVLDAVRSTGARAVVVLPNDPDTLAVARAAAATAREEGLHVTVVPTRAQVQGLAAAAVHDPAVDHDQDVAAMSAAAGATRHGAVTIAAREAITMAGRCEPGDVLGVVDGDFAVIGQDVDAVAEEVVHRLLSGGGEMVTLVTGLDAPPALAASVSAVVRRTFPTVEVVVVDGGQPRYPLLVGVE